MTPPLNRDAAMAWYQAQADAAQAPRLRQLLREARLRLGQMDPLRRRINQELNEQDPGLAGDEPAHEQRKEWAS